VYAPFWRRDDVRDSEATVVAVGDVMLSRGVGETIAHEGIDSIFAGIADALKADVTFGNLEGPISDRGQPNPGSLSQFRASPDVVGGLVRAGFDVLNVANNHTYDFLGPAVEDTLRLLSAAGIRTVGVGSSFEQARLPAILDLGDLRIAFLGYTSMRNVIDRRFDYVAAPLDLETIEQDIGAMKERGSRVVISLHFGHEDIEYPPPECRRQARAIIGMGADAVLGHHPHVIQGIEVFEGGLIAYSMGNFVFDHADPRRQSGLMVRFGLDGDGLTRVEFLPVAIGEDGRVAPAEGAEREEAIAHIRRLSGFLADGSSDRRFWNASGDSFLGTYGSSLCRTLNRRGIRGLLRLLLRARPKHLRILWTWFLRTVLQRRGGDEPATMDP